MACEYCGYSTSKINKYTSKRMGIDYWLCYLCAILPNIDELLVLDDNPDRNLAVTSLGIKTNVFLANHLRDFLRTD